MYKVFFNHNVVYLLKNQDSSIPFAIKYIDPDAETIQNLIKALLTNKKKEVILFECTDLKLTWKIFKEQFTIKKAAGGIVINQNKELLLIKRKGLWDLPKGHIEKAEKTKTAALREVSEECGIFNQAIERKLFKTYHVYYLNEIPVLKPSVWYLMKYSGTKKTEPQKKEGITEAIWVPLNLTEQYIEKSYPSVGYLLQPINGADFLT